MIDVSGMTRRYGSRTAVDSISFSIPRGETFGLLGTNGAGKTTTISVLIGMLNADDGSVAIDGDCPTEAATRRRIGIAPQALSLYEAFTAEENLRFFARLYDITGTRLTERIAWALEFSGLTDRRRHRVSTFSGGMKRRLNLACAMIHDPDIILLDEPTVGVDPQSRNHIFERIEELKRLQRTMIYTTHYMEEAQRLCDRVAIMDHGRLLAVDTVPELVRCHGGESVVDAELAELPADTDLLPAAVTEGNRLRFSAVDPMTSVLQLSQAGLEFSTLTITQPNLECVFLNLTGRQLRDH